MILHQVDILYLVESKGPNGNDGVLRLFGTKYGCDLTTTAITSGAALGDLAGYAITFVGMEPNPGNITDEEALWATGKQGSLVAADIKAGQTINDVDGTDHNNNVDNGVIRGPLFT